ncbi:MAG: hypothetical protein BWY42_00791 [Candidatus Omnitrophica bacterium ADurb.Bin277]|nr:MAG: hypothetical protein BWY42_00791 [Candidatus Omnitrophica bacterium ADurb.Bin277]
MRRTFLLILIAAGLFLSFGTAGILCAEEDDISVKAEVDKAFLTIGDLVTYTVTITHDPEIKILTRIPSPDTSVLEIKKIEDVNLKEKKKRVTGRRFVLTTYRLGDFVLDPVTIRYQTADGSEKSIQTNKIYLSVKSIAEGEPKEDIRDVKSVVSLTRRFARIGTVLLVAVAVLAGYWIYSKFLRKRVASLIPETVLSPEDEALSLLRELFDSDLLRKGFVKIYYLKLSEILRVYLEKRYGILAVESTTYEIMRSLRETAIPQSLKEKMNYVLSSSDLAKFAKWVPPPTEVVTINKRAEEIVLESAPETETANASSGEAPHGV